MRCTALSTLLFGAFYDVNSHSWMECSDYDADINGRDYESENCKGYPRDWDSYNSGTFAQDVGADNRPTGIDDWCQREIGTPNDYTASYTTEFPMTQYVAGNTYRVVWPAKNHANSNPGADCRSNIPDNSMKLFFNSQVNPSSDPSTIDDWTLVWDFQEGCTPGSFGCGFQNCPDYCAEEDAAVCYGDFELDPSLISEDGVYTFMWYWAFNSESDLYATCYEAYVTGGDGGSDDGGSESNANGSSGSSSSGDPVGSAVVAIVVVLVIVLVLIGAGILYQKMQAKKLEQGQSGQVAFAQTNNNAAITTTGTEEFA